MRVFVTGASGFIGSGVVAELLRAGHSVLGLARSDAAAAAVARMGAAVHRGSVVEPDSLAAAARECDGVAHLAFNHDFSRYLQNCEDDRVALAAMADALAGTGKPLISTSGTGVLAAGRMGFEADAPSPDSPAFVRGASEAVLAAAARGVRAIVIRLPPTVHGRGEHGFVPMMIDLARTKGVAGYLGDGGNVWPAVHRDDAARLYRLALEGAAPGTVLHGVGESAIAMRDIAGAIGAGLGVPVRSISEDEAGEHFGWMAMFAGLNGPASSARTREILGWAPVAVGLLEDMRGGGYFG